MAVYCDANSPIEFQQFLNYFKALVQDVKYREFDIVKRTKILKKFSKKMLFTIMKAK